MTNLEITNAYVGSNQAVKLYLGGEAIWPSTPPEPVYSAMPLTFEIISGGTIVWFSKSNPRVIEYSKDNGVTWTSITSSTATSFTVETGDKVQFRGSNLAHQGIGGNSDAMCSSFIGSGATESTAVFEVYGNIMSLLVPTGYEALQFVGETNCFRSLFNHFGNTTSQSLISAKHLILPDNVVDSCYRGMFIRCAGLVEAPEIPATTLTNNCYQYMFQGCTSLATAPELPATTLANNCYQGMFQGCTSLTTAPSILPATTLADSCYSGMFNGCTSLTSAPELPAITLANSCYYNMFQNCTSLTSAPKLPAATLAEGCYGGMFRNCSSLTTAPSVLPATTLARDCYTSMFNSCSSLTTAPELPATTLVNACYRSMFSGCTSLNYIKCLATDISAPNCTNNWVRGVAETGTFVKIAGIFWITGSSGIPSGWDEEEIEA